MVLKFVYSSEKGGGGVHIQEASKPSTIQTADLKKIQVIRAGWAERLTRGVTLEEADPLAAGGWRQVLKRARVEPVLRGRAQQPSEGWSRACNRESRNSCCLPVRR